MLRCCVDFDINNVLQMTPRSSKMAPLGPLGPWLLALGPWALGALGSPGGAQGSHGAHQMPQDRFGSNLAPQNAQVAQVIPTPNMDQNDPKHVPK